MFLLEIRYDADAEYAILSFRRMFILRCTQGPVGTDNKASRTTVAGVGGAFSSADSSPYHRPLPPATRSGPGAASQSRPSVASGGGNLSGSFASGVLLPRADSGAAFHAVFHGVDPDIASSPPPDDSNYSTEKLGCIQFKLSYDFQVLAFCVAM